MTSVSGYLVHISVTLTLWPFFSSELETTLMKSTVVILIFFSYISFVHCLQFPTAHPSVGSPKD